MPNLKINNKTYSGVSEVHIPLADGSGNEDFAYINSETKSITENGTHDVTHYGTVNVDVPSEGITPTGTKTITENGTYDVTEYASAKVAVPAEEPNIQSLNVIANGTYTAPSGIDGYSPVTVSVPTGSDIELQQKTVSPSTSQQTVTPDSGYDGLSQVTVNAMPTATQATPSITVSTAGLITASATQIAGYVAAGTKSATKQLTTQAAQTIIPGTSDQTISSERYLIGTQTVKGDANLVAENIKEGVSIFNILGTYAGSGGLPDGVRKLITGIYEPSSDDTSAFVVTHNFGETPTFAMLLLCDDVTTASLTSAKVMQFQFHKRMMAGSALQTMRGSYLYYGSSGTISTGGLSDSASQYATTTTVTFAAHTSYPLKAGCKYRWVVGVLEDVVI